MRASVQGPVRPVWLQGSRETVFGVLAGFAQCNDFGVVEKVVFVPAFADDLAGAVEDDAAHRRVGRGEGDAAPGQLEGALHPVGVLMGRVHDTGIRWNHSV